MRVRAPAWSLISRSEAVLILGAALGNPPGTGINAERPVLSARPVAIGTASNRKWACAGASPSGSAPLLAPRGESCMGHRFLRGFLPVLLLPPPRRSPHLKLNLEPVSTSKRPRSHLMAPPRIGTHNGTFHCDEALACALLRLLPEYRVGTSRAN